MNLDIDGSFLAFQRFAKGTCRPIAYHGEGGRQIRTARILELPHFLRSHYSQNSVLTVADNGCLLLLRIVKRSRMHDPALRLTRFRPGRGTTLPDVKLELVRRLIAD